MRPATRFFRPAVLELESRLVPATTVASFANLGLWEYQDTTGQWAQLTGANPSSFLVDKDTDRRLLGDFTFGYTVHRNVELFGALLTASNRNTRGAETDRRDPELIKSFGDLVLGAKGQMPLARGANVGFELGLKFLSSVRS